jgi:hypothetical protein
MGGCSRAAAACAVLWLTMDATTHAAPAKIGGDVRTQLDRTGEAEVFVMLREPRRADGGDMPARGRAIATQHDVMLASLPAHDVRVHQRFSTVSGFSASVTAEGLARLLAHPEVLRVDPMQYGSAALAQSVPQIRADAVHRRDDLGQDVTVAVLDSGVNSEHPDLAGSIVAEECFCSFDCCPDGTSRQSGPGSAVTTFVHGIHVAGIIVSKGIVAPVGVAPGAKLVAVKVLDDLNRGSLADWIAALDWIATTRLDVQVVNMSLVRTKYNPVTMRNEEAVFSSPCDEADGFNMGFAQAFEALRARGVLTFVAAGNSGAIGETAAPGCVGAAVSVGAVTKRDEVWNFSDSNAALDLLAPGVDITSTGPGRSTALLTGTSMATAHATGTAALMLALNPGLGADDLEQVLKDTGRQVVDTRNGLSFPRLNALSAMNAVLDTMRPLLGGGGAASDCLVEWSFPPATTTLRHPRAGGAVCRDNDPSCDADSIRGRCTFHVSICFNVPDRRLPRCSTSAPIDGYTLFSPSPTRRGDVFDTANASAISRALPALPIVDANHCTAPIELVVPAGAKPGTKWIRFSARGADGRMDHDRLRLTCAPAQSEP